MPEVPNTGYHHIPLPPALTCHLHPQYGNIRILDARQEEVPFIFTEEDGTSGEVYIRWFDHLGRDDIRSDYTRSIFENSRSHAVDRMVLKIRNADVNRHFWLSGSDDNKNWYIIREDYQYNSYYDPTSTFVLLTIGLPPSNYRYYKVEVKHAWREPIQVMDAGFYDADLADRNFTALPVPVVRQTDNASERTSTVEIDFGDDHYVDQFYLEVDGPEFYQRRTEVFAENLRMGGRQMEKVKDFDLSSRHVNMLTFDSRRSRRWKIVIHNRDDKPVRITGSRAYQARKFLTARLEQGQQYQVIVGPETQRAPEYDLEFFRKDIPKTLTEVTPGVLLPMGVSPGTSSVSPSANPASSFTNPASGASAKPNGGMGNRQSSASQSSAGAATAGSPAQQQPDTVVVSTASWQKGTTPVQQTSLAGQSASGEEKNQPEWWIWAAIGGVVVVLGVFSIRMLREQGKGQDETADGG